MPSSQPLERQRKFRLAILLNPLAGLGGPAGLKGSDAPETAQLASQRGVKSQVYSKLARVLDLLEHLSDQIELVTSKYPMGPVALDSWQHSIRYEPPDQTDASDTAKAVKAMLATKPDLLLFVGGDGTARDVYSALDDQCPVLGVPAGVKMHSGVFAVTPEAAASVVMSLTTGRLVAVRAAEVRDIDEAAFAKGQVKTRYFGEMQVPDDQMLVQKVKCSGLPDDEILLEDLSAYVAELIDEDDSESLWMLGSGGTLKAVKEKLGIDDPTLLGVDLWAEGKLVAKDCFESEIWNYVQQYTSHRVVLSVIGGQGIVLGRGNQQLSARIIEACGVDNLTLVSTTEKMKALEGRPLYVDSGSPTLDQRLAGFHKIICGFEESVLYSIESVLPKNY